MMKAAVSASMAANPVPPLRLVLVGPASDGGVAVLGAGAGALAELTGAALLPWPANGAGADAAMADLDGRGGSWLAALPQDPGEWQPWGGRWSEVLGAWRQPTLLLVDAHQATTGLPAATTALLERSGVPLIGLIQVGGRFDGETRRRDGLPWLGVLGGAGDDAPQEPDVLLALRWRWSRIAAEA